MQEPESENEAAKHWRSKYQELKAQLSQVHPSRGEGVSLDALIPLAATLFLNVASLALLAPVALMEEPPKQYMALSVFVYAIAGVTLIVDLFLFLDALVFRSFSLPKILGENKHGEVGWLVGALVLGIALVVASR